MNFPPKKILVATDFSDCAKHAIELAASIARQEGAALGLIHVVSFAETFADGMSIEGGWSGDLQGLADERADELLKAESDRLRAAGILVEAAVRRQGSPYLAVAAEAAKGGYQLVVCGTHGRTGVRHLLLGSVAEGIVRHCKCSVLVARD